MSQRWGQDSMVSREKLTHRTSPVKSYLAAADPDNKPQTVPENSEKEENSWMNSAEIFDCVTKLTKNQYSSNMA